MSILQVGSSMWRKGMHQLSRKNHTERISPGTKEQDDPLNKLKQ